MRVKILPAPSTVHDGVSRYVASLVRALSEEGVSVVHAGEDYDVLHLTAAHTYDPEWRQAKARGKRLVVTVHDLIPEHLKLKGPQYSGVSERAEILSAADAVIAVSQYTKDDIVRTYGIPAEKIRVVHNGGVSPVSTLHARIPVTSCMPYILWVGRRAGYKNFFWFVRAIVPLLKRNNWRVVCTGGQDFGRKERLLMVLLGVRDRFRVVRASDADLAELYRHAVCLAMPSRMEGFGLPIVEAMSNGCPVVIPRGHVFPEIACDAAQFHEPGNILDFRAKVISCVDPQVRQRIQKAAPDILAHFSWQRCAQHTVAAYASPG